jgi:uncharacterized integral membrane protein
MAEPDQSEQKHFASTRTSRAWWSLAAGLLLLLLVVIFMAQNGSDVPVRFLWIKGHTSLGVALFASALLGGLSVLLLGAARVLQLRRRAKRAQRRPSD